MVSNLINNSLEAIDGPGRVSISTKRAGSNMAVVIQDSGRGMSEEVRARATEKGFSHGKESGTGLGLNHAFQQVRAWGGIFLVQSEPGKGTSIYISLPLTPEDNDEPR